MTDSKYLFGTCVILIAFLYAGLCLKIDVGYFNDDARYIMSACSLNQGQYRDLELPGHPLNVDRLPGYPLFLTPFVRVIMPRWAWLKVLSIALTLSGCFLLNTLFADSMTPLSRLSLIAFFGLNPTIIKYSCSVMSEPFFLFLLLLSFLLYGQWLKRRQAWRFWLISLPLSWAVITRPEGLALLGSLSGSLAIHREHRASLKLLIIPALILSSLLLCNYFSGSSPSGYLQQMGQILIYLSGRVLPWAMNAGLVLKVAFVDSLLQAAIPIQNVILNLLVISGFIALGLGLVLIGFNALRRGASRQQQTLQTAQGIFVLLYFLMHIVFLSVNNRYFFSVIPLLLAWFMIGGAALLASMDKRIVWAWVAVVGFLCCYINPWTSPSDKLWGTTHSYAIPRQTYQWIEQSTSPQSFILSVKASATHLYTERYSISEIQAASWHQFCESLLNDGITHVLIAPSRLMLLSGQRFQNMLSIWNDADNWTRQWPDVFVKVYENPQEGTRLFLIDANKLRKRMDYGK